MDTTRRNLLRTALFGAGCVGLRAVASGVPLAWLMGGEISEARADSEDLDLAPQSLILFTSQAGDPFNANTPGSYGVPGVYNNPNPQMAATPITLGEQNSTAALPWTQVPQRFLDRTTFIHHRTYLNTHPGYSKVLGLVGSAKAPGGNGSDQVAAVYSSELADPLSTIQPEPVSLAQGDLSFQGRALQSLRPRMLREMFAPQTGVQFDLQQLRDETLDNLHAQLKESGTHAQKVWLDRYALSREQARQIDESLLERFSAIENDSAQSQVSAAVTLILMKVSPVIAIRIPFGGDNHQDDGLIKERDETIAGIAIWQSLLEELEAVGLQDEVTIANLNVFGRTLRQLDGTRGRDHNLNHHVMAITGVNVRGSVVGGIEPSGNDYGATGIDSVTGASDNDADIPGDATLESASKTLGRVLGIPHDTLEERIDRGKPIEASILGA